MELCFFFSEKTRATREVAVVPLIHLNSHTEAHKEIKNISAVSER